MSDSLSGLYILVVEDDPNRSLQIVSTLQERGCIVTGCSNYEDAVKTVSQDSQDFRIAIVDMYIPLNKESPHDRVMRGEELAIAIRGIRPSIKVIGISEYIDREPFTPFSNLFASFINKGHLSYSDDPTSILIETIDGVLAGRKLKTLQSFIVHGHDEHSLLSLKNYLQNGLGLPEPVVLREQPSMGKTIIEKFEESADHVDLVFVILTPDDAMADAPDRDRRRSRQNVIFELGFFYGKLRRSSGQVILLHKGKVELPNDIQGVVWVPIDDGVESAGEVIRRELRGMGWHE